MVVTRTTIKEIEYRNGIEFIFNQGKELASGLKSFIKLN